MVIGKMKKEIQNEIKTVLDHAHSQGVDIFGFGWYLYRVHHQRWTSEWKDGWEDTLQGLKVNVDVDADIQRTTLFPGVSRRNDKMDIGIIVVWLSLIGYLIITLKAKIVEKKERKWVYFLVIAAIGFSFLIMRNISLNIVISFLNNTFGGISRMVVNI